MTTEKKRAPKPVHHVRIRLNFVIGFKEPVAALPEGVRRLEDFIVGGLKAAGIEADELIRGAEVSATMVSDPRKRGGR